MTRISKIQEYINSNALMVSIKRSKGLSFDWVEILPEKVMANVFGTTKYRVVVTFNRGKVDSSCTCPYDQGGICKHEIVVLEKLIEHYELNGEPKTADDNEISHIEKSSKKTTTSTSKKSNTVEKPIEFSSWKSASTEIRSRINAGELFSLENPTYEQIEENFVKATIRPAYYHYSKKSAVSEIRRVDDKIFGKCTCGNKDFKLCAHVAHLFIKLMEDYDKYSIVFPDVALILLKDALKSKGIEYFPGIEKYYQIHTEFGRTYLKISDPSLVLVNDLTTKGFKNVLEKPKFIPKKNEFWPSDQFPLFIVHHENYNSNPEIQLFLARTAKNGDFKNPIMEADSMMISENCEDKEDIKFFQGCLYLEQNEVDLRESKSEHYLKVAKRVLLSPREIPLYFHNPKVSDKFTVKSIEEKKLQADPVELSLRIKEDEYMFTIHSRVVINGDARALSNFKVREAMFLQEKENVWLMPDFTTVNLVALLNSRGGKISIFKSQFDDFRKQFLAPLEEKIYIEYTFITPQNKKKHKELIAPEVAPIKRIYLTESEDYIVITPVIAYPLREINPRNKNRVYALTADNDLVEVDRVPMLEEGLIELVENSHESFAEQETFDYYYIHKHEFLADNWFLHTFEAWKEEGIEIYGFNELTNNKLSPNKMKVNISVKSGINWFDATVNVSFGTEKLRLRDLQKAIFNRQKYIQLGDGKLGLIPDEWVEKFGKFFRSSELTDQQLRIPKSHFQYIDTLFDQEVLPNEILKEVADYKTKFQNFSSIGAVTVPKKLKAKLRDYQKEGLNWLNFLDEFNFGGCLADDMGLGKTVQVLAFLLHLQTKNGSRPHLLVLPTSLIFNWQQEIKKFAPSLKCHVIYGLNREKDHESLTAYDLIITTYGVLLSDVEYLKNVDFDYVILDESQAIKNPESKRYKAVRLLKARNRLVLSGTPVENNTFDLYAQFSFAHPGLLGNRTFFKDNYSTPIDKFKDMARAKELQQKLQPFLLRRTKKQVATELPDKTEMVVLCEMGTEQRRVYETYRKEFQDFIENSKDADLTNNSMHILQGLTKLRQLCNSPSLLKSEPDYGQQSAKLDELMDQLSNKVNNHKILVFSQFVSMLDLIEKRLQDAEIGYTLLTGQTKNRQEVVEKFQTDDSKRVFLISLKAGGAGLNLTEADYVYLVDPWWNPAVENQAIDRCYRIGQTKKVVAIRLICANSIEEKIQQLQESKKELVDELIKVDTSASKSLSKNDLLTLLG